MAQPAVLPGVMLVNPNAHQVRHNVGESVVMIALDPHNFDVALGIRQLADVTEKFPVIFGEASKIEVCEDIAEKYQPVEAILLQHASGFPRMARLRTEMQVRKDQRVVHGQIHSSVVANEC